MKRPPQCLLHNDNFVPAEDNVIFANTLSGILAMIMKIELLAFVSKVHPDLLFYTAPTPKFKYYEKEEHIST